MLDESTSALSRKHRYVEGLLSRVVVALVFIALFVALAFLRMGLSWAQAAPAIAVLVLLAGLNIPYWYLGKRAGFPLSQFYGHWAGDLILITVIAYLLGGLDVPLMQFGYLMMIITAALFVSQRAAYRLAVGATLVYGLLGLAETVGWIPHREGVWAHHYGIETRVFIVAISSGFFFLLAYLAGTLSEMLRRANEELATTKGIVEEQNRSLERRVGERTRELEARTCELQARAEELQELVRIVTHDLQNVAVAGTETTRKLVDLDRANLSPRGQRYVDRLQGDCRLMANMLRGLLEVVTQSEVAERREIVNVTKVVREAIGRAHNVVESKGIAIRVGELPPIVAEEQKMYHVFENLLTNACKYVGDKPNPSIEIEGFVADGRIEYVVRDNGVGIEPCQVDRIFQLYHRAPNQSVAGMVQQGQGIGLQIVRRIVQRYGGRIWVESVLGEGSSFRVSFPREVGEPGEEMRDSA